MTGSRSPRGRRCKRADRSHAGSVRDEDLDLIGVRRWPGRGRSAGSRCSPCWWWSRRLPCRCGRSARRGSPRSAWGWRTSRSLALLAVVGLLNDGDVGDLLALQGDLDLHRAVHGGLDRAGDGAGRGRAAGARPLGSPSPSPRRPRSPSPSASSSARPARWARRWRTSRPGSAAGVGDVRRRRVGLERKQRGEPGGGAAEGQDGAAHETSMAERVGTGRDGSEIERLVVDAAPRVCPAARSAATAVWVMPGGPHTYASYRCRPGTVRCRCSASSGS